MNKPVVRNDLRTVITFDGPVQEPGQELGFFCGTVSQITWDSNDMMTALRQMFGCSDNEIITAIEVTSCGIKAQFKRVGVG